MTLAHYQPHFRKPVQTLAELELPPPNPDFRSGQPLDMQKGDRYHIYDRRGRAYADFQFVRWQDNVMGGRFAELRQVGAGETLLLYEDQILELEKLNRIVAVNALRPDLRNMPGSVHSLSGGEVTEALRRIDYADALNREMDFRRSDVLPDEVRMRVAAEVAERRGERCPSKSWLCKIMRIERHGVALNRLVKFAPARTRGNRNSRFPAILYEIRTRAIQDALSSRMGAEDARIRFKKLVSEGAEYAWARDLALDERGQPVMRLSSFKKGIAAVDRYTRDRLRIGEEYAAREHSRSVRSQRPKGILDVVDVDYTTLPVKVYDPLLPTLAYGRPHLLAFRERYSGIVLGYDVSFSAPCFESFIAGVRHAMFPKDELASSVSWPWFGKWKRLGVDHEAHLVGDQMLHAQAMLGFELTEYRPRVPEDKGALEHLFHVLDVGLLQSMPGHTPRPAKRKRLDFDEQEIQAEISIVELRAILDDYFANRINRSPRRGIGDLPSLRAVPDEIWQQEIRSRPPRKLVDPQAFEWLAGETRNVTIQDDGITFDHLVYQSEELLVVTTNPAHQRGVRDDRGRVHRSTTYAATRPHWDVGHIWLIDHHRGNYPVRVPVDPGLASYANGLNAYQHRLVVDFKKRELEQTGRDPAFREAYERLRNMQIEFHVKTRRDENSRKIARHLERQGLKIERSKSLDLTWVDSGERTSLAEPTRIEAREPVSLRAARRPRPVSRAREPAPNMIVSPISPQPSESPSPDQQTGLGRMSLAELRMKRSLNQDSKET